MVGNDISFVSRSKQKASCKSDWTEYPSSGRLWLEREPSVEEVKKEFEKFDMTQYNEVVFCGFGEPTERFDALKEVAAFVKEKYNKPIRINTNGAGSLINGRDIAPELKGLVDTVSVSLNHPEKEEYLKLVPEKSPLQDPLRILRYFCLHTLKNRRFPDQ